MSVPHNRNGGLTLVAMPGFELQARRVAETILRYGTAPGKKRKRTPVDIVIPEFGRRASGEPFLRLGKQHIGGHDVIILASGPGTWETLGQINLLLRYVAARRATRVALVTGYFPLSRSDKDEGEFELALCEYVISQMIAAAKTMDFHLDRIIAADLHAAQIVMAGPTGLITELSLIRLVLRPAIVDALEAKERICLIYPDDSAAKRFAKPVEMLERQLGIKRLPSVVGIKRRTSSTEAELKELFGDTDALEGATGISVDDEIATAKTNVLSAEMVKTAYKARRVNAVVTHGVLCEPALERLLAPNCAIDRVYATDTIPFENRPALRPLIDAGRLVTVDWSEELGISLFHHHWDLSIRNIR